MTKIKIEGVVEHLSDHIRKALDEAVKRTIPDSNPNSSKLFSEFKRNLVKKCNDWERIPDRYAKNE